MLDVLIEEYLVELQMKGCVKNTVKQNSNHLNRFKDFLVRSNLDYLTITAKNIKSFRNELIGCDLKPKTVNGMLSVVKCFYDFLVAEQNISAHPIILKRLRIKDEQRLPAFMTDEELGILYNWMTGIPGHISLGIRTMLATGLRIGELTALTPKDFIPLNNGGYVFRVRHGKGNKERYVPILDVEVLKDLLRFIGDRNDDLTVFGSAKQTFINWAGKCRLDTGMHFHCHRCRHTVGTRLLQRGVSIDKVQEVLGHENISTTRHYARTAPEAILELAAKVDKLREPRAVYRYWL
jgi:site-specific recombinase XerD